MSYINKCLSLFLSLFAFYCFRYFQVSLFRVSSLILFSPDSNISFSFTGLYPIVLCLLSLIIVSYHFLLFVQSFFFIDPFFNPLKSYLPLISFLLNLSFFTISFFLVTNGDFYLWLLEVFFFVFYFSFVYFFTSNLSNSWLVSNGFSIVYIFLSILTGFLFCYLLLPDSPLLAMETPELEGDRQNLVEAWDNGRLVEVPYTLPERNIDLSTPNISYYANPLSLRWPLSGYSVPLYPTDTTALSASSSLVPLLHLVDTPLTAVSVLPELIYNEGWNDLFVIYNDGKGGNIVSIHKWTPMLNSYYRYYDSGQLPTIYSFDSSILSSYRIDYLQIANLYGFSTNNLYMNSLDPGLEVVMSVKHNAYNFYAESNLYSLSSILSYMTPSIGVRDSFTGNRFLSSLSSLLYGTHFHTFSPLKSNYVNWLFPGSSNSHNYLTYHLLSNIVMVNPDSWVTTTPPKGSGCVPCLGSSTSSSSLVLPFSNSAALSSHYFCKNFVFICSCCRSWSWVPTRDYVPCPSFNSKV